MPFPLMDSGFRRNDVVLLNDVALPNDVVLPNDAVFPKVSFARNLLTTAI